MKIKTQNRKIGFNYIILQPFELELDIKSELQQLFAFISSQTKQAKKIDLSNVKFCFLESSELIDGDYHKLIFKSATHSYRAPLLDRTTVDERDNPKTLREGEVQKSHFLIKYKDRETILIAEKFRGGISVLQFIEYLNQYIKIYEKVRSIKLNYIFSHEIIVKNNLEEALDNLNRVFNASVYVDKQMLGSESLNFSERIDHVKESIIIDIRANRKENIKETVKDVLAKCIGCERKVKKIKIKGKNLANNDITIDTDFFEKREYVKAQLNEETGEVNSKFLLRELIEIAKTL